MISIFWALNLGDLYHRRSDLLGDGIVLQGTMGTEFFNFDIRKKLNHQWFLDKS